MTSLPSVKKNFALSTAYQILSVLVPFITAPYVSRVLGADGVGVYSFTNSIVSYFVLFAALGTMSYGAREISRSRDNREQRSQLFWEIELLVGCTTFVCLLIWLFWIVLAPEYNVIYLILTMSLVGVVVDISWFFTGLEQFNYIVLRNSIVKIVGVICLFVFIREKDDLTLYIFLMTLINLLGALSMWVYVPKMVDKPKWKSLRIRHHLKETLIYFIPAIATSIYTILNKVLLGFVGDDIRENGYYEQATKIIAICQALTFTALNSVLGARIAYLFVEQKIEEIRQYIDNSLQYVLLVGIGIGTALIAIAPRFVPWFFGEGFEPTIILIQLLSPIVLIIGISNCLGSQYYTPAGLRKESARYIIIGAVVNLIFNILLIPRLGAIGAVIGSLTAELTITVLYLYNCNGYMTLKQIFINGWRKIIAAIVMFIVIWHISHAIENDTLSVILASLAGITVYAVLLLLIRDKFTSHLFEMVRAKLRI